MNSKTYRTHWTRVGVFAVSLLFASACGDVPVEPKAPTIVVATPPVAATAKATTQPAGGSLATPQGALDALEEAYLGLLVRCFPETGTSLGLHDGDALLDPRETGAFLVCIDHFERMLTDVDAVFAAHDAALTPTQRVDFELLRGTLRTRVRSAREENPLALVPTTYTEPFQALFLMMSRDYAPARDRARSMLARIEKLPEVVELAKANLTKPPKVFTEIGIDRAKSAKDFFVDVEAFIAGALPAEKAHVAKAVKEAKRAYSDYAAYLEKTVLPRSTGTYAVGKDFFEFLLRESYFLDGNSGALFEMGRATMAKTIAEMDAVAKRIDPKAKNWVSVVAAEKRRHPKEAELIDAYRKEVLRARAFLAEHDIVSFPEGDDLDVVATPVFLRSTTSAAYDQPPPFDPSTKGFFFVTPVEKEWSAAKKEAWLSESDFGDLVDTAVHEAYPGHHLQLSFARRHPSRLRKIVDSAIFSEGWALYCEELMAELAYYKDSERLMQLQWTLVRAARVVIDVGLHTRGMTLAEAVKILRDDVHLGADLATNEVKRYAMSPTQPLSYLTGREAIFALRERVKKAQGAEFSLKRFHDMVLSKGSIPPGLIERELFPPAQKVR